MELNEHRIYLIESSIDKTVVKPVRFLVEQRSQAFVYFIGSICFTAGSCMYFTDVHNIYPRTLTAAGWLFTVGSSLYIVGDLYDWWSSRTGYCFESSASRRSYVRIDATNEQSTNEQTPIEIEMYTYGSTSGMLFYLVGSILFIPIFENYVMIGDWFFIIGASFCCLSLLWKIYRSACISLDEPSHRRARLFNLFNDRTTLLIDSCSLIGNICFFIGTIEFLPYFNRTNADANRAASLFVVGSSFFVLSSICLQYTLHYLQHG
jgi:hypothetical protein